MLGDGKTEYDQAHDGEANAIGQCEVRIIFYTLGVLVLTCECRRISDVQTSTPSLNSHTSRIHTSM